MFSLTALLLRTQQVSGSSLGLDTGRSFVVFFSPFKKVVGLYFKLGHTNIVPYTFQFIDNLSSLHKPQIGKLYVNS